MARCAFKPLFERQAQTEKIRSVQGMLQRFRTLFNLPSTICESSSKGEHDLAIREYKKAIAKATIGHLCSLQKQQSFWAEIGTEEIVNEIRKRPS
ncbi:hypothetical protein Dsin_001296 [Dipteronia sinensis]|uniref:Exocyst complex component SEC5 n=1 Tax=Dipteronia sinensis TaxID=43782 RepID=A0AAE0B516_9ROSI|nr:hypothetical protein Dsin_001296 [Dipteronia sinensis]